MTMIEERAGASRARTEAAADLGFLPYGWMPRSYAEDLMNAAHAPSRLRDDTGSAMTDAQWGGWLDTQADELASTLWPRWLGNRWSSSPDPAIVRADLDLMASLAPCLGERVALGPVTHARLFSAEDNGPPNFAGFLAYAQACEPEWWPALSTRLDDLLREGGIGIAAPVSLQLKLRMQRPRPYQVALWMRPTFSCEQANSATTPSMVSGHCLQGAVALVYVVVALEAQHGRPMGSEALGALQRFFIDVGDRRVFAGVHYPTDNLSSWFVALRMCRQLVFGGPDIAKDRERARAVLWQAISTHSRVFRAVQGAAAAEGSPYTVPLQWLKKEALG